MLEHVLDADFVHFPFDHQLREFERYAEADARALAWTMRTGKSKLTIDRACHMHKAGLIDGLLVLAPNGVHANWVDRELPAHGWPSVPVEPLVWRTRVAGAKGGGSVPKALRSAWEAERAAWWSKLKAARGSNALAVLSVPTESMIRDDVRKAIAYFVKHRRTFLAVDEVDDFGTPGSKRTSMVRALARRCPKRIILSGTLLTGSLLAAFSEFEILERGALGFTRNEDFVSRYAEFEEARGQGGRTFSKFARYKNEDELRGKIAKFSSVVIRDQVRDMPALVQETRSIELSPEQRAAYEEARESFLVAIAGEKRDLGENAPRLQKLQQICQGFVRDSEKRTHIIPGVNPRLEALAEEVYLTPGKVIVWAHFHADIDAAANRLLSEGHRVVQYHGRMTDEEKSRALTIFRNDGEAKVLVGHAQSAGRGLDMSVASTIIWYSHSWSARLRAQALERATKIGGGNIRVVDFEAPGPDAYILKTLRDRADVADRVAGLGLVQFLEELRL